MWALATPSYYFVYKYNHYIFYLVLDIALIFHIVPLRHFNKMFCSVTIFVVTNIHLPFKNKINKQQ